MYFGGQAYEDFVKEYSGAPGFLRRAREPGVGGMLAARRLALYPQPTGVGTPRNHQGLDTLTTSLPLGMDVPNASLATVAFLL